MLQFHIFSHPHGLQHDIFPWLYWFPADSLVCALALGHCVCIRLLNLGSGPWAGFPGPVWGRFVPESKCEPTKTWSRIFGPAVWDRIWVRSH